MDEKMAETVGEATVGEADVQEAGAIRR